ncbi:hypothetical protein SNOG_09775 [Parastagonospora nodorum SN15]|uniref:Uncharacterized protein n=1 Tax=Phaeosphaeria nodorum (strain SN15 / ATCC MYA-4574 / FGSC 10173) TaxID=321614 RepID=Q0UEN9_PHANO|nr:hypothetical protein SNOG_09775 [Parastagonospora nodorum SN15]EAT83040.1 hypothetical protein SNOG_09775 [Parastagonospora nodorum SN15]
MITSPPLLLPWWCFKTQPWSKGYEVHALKQSTNSVSDGSLTFYAWMN